jgi:hypothetical protein
MGLVTETIITAYSAAGAKIAAAEPKQNVVEGEGSSNSTAHADFSLPQRKGDPSVCPPTHGW